MPRRPEYVRKSKARDAACRFLGECGIDAPPVPAMKLLMTLSRLFFYSNDQGVDFDNEEGFTVPTETGYETYINKDLPAGRDNFTYLHEAGHIQLGHHKEFHIDMLTPKEQKIINREADIFAANVLMPEEWVRKYVQLPITRTELARLKRLYGASWESLIICLDKLGLWPKRDSYAIFQTADPSHSCVSQATRDNPGVATNNNFCNIPGNLLTLRPRKSTAEVGGRLSQCPICGYSDFSLMARYCIKCGTLLFNRCTNVSKPVSIHCGHVNPPDALFCECCGAETTMYRSYKAIKQVLPINQLSHQKKIHERWQQKG